MFQRDYILRMIEMMGDFMRRVGELMDELSQLRLMDGLCRRQCGLPLRALETLATESLLELLAPAPRLFASELLYNRALMEGVAIDEADELRLKSFRLLVSLCDEGALCEARAARAQELKLALLNSLDTSDLMQCARFLYEGERYADMEDAIFEAAERADGGERADAVKLGISLLRDAAKADAGALALARTSSGELRLSARELEQMKL